MKFSLANWRPLCTWHVRPICSSELNSVLTTTPNVEIRRIDNYPCLSGNQLRQRRQRLPTKDTCVSPKNEKPLYVAHPSACRTRSSFARPDMSGLSLS
jgi:hypothetical protein